MAKTRSKPKGRKAALNNNGSDYDRLLRLAKENPWRQFNVSEIRILHNIQVKPMTRLRKLAALDEESDPWDGDFTRPEKFFEWYWGGKRKELEKKALQENKRI